MPYASARKTASHRFDVQTWILFRGIELLVRHDLTTAVALRFGVDGCMREGERIAIGVPNIRPSHFGAYKVRQGLDGAIS